MSISKKYSPEKSKSPTKRLMNRSASVHSQSSSRSNRLLASVNYESVNQNKKALHTQYMDSLKSISMACTSQSVNRLSYKLPFGMPYHEYTA